MNKLIICLVLFKYYYFKIENEILITITFYMQVAKNSQAMVTLRNRLHIGYFDQRRKVIK